MAGGRVGRELGRRIGLSNGSAEFSEGNRANAQPGPIRLCGRGAARAGVPRLKSALQSSSGFGSCGLARRSRPSKGLIASGSSWRFFVALSNWRSGTVRENVSHPWFANQSRPSLSLINCAMMDRTFSISSSGGPPVNSIFILCTLLAVGYFGSPHIEERKSNGLKDVDS